jgi:hypothetical protein
MSGGSSGHRRVLAPVPTQPPRPGQPSRKPSAREAASGPAGQPSGTSPGSTHGLGRSPHKRPGWPASRARAADPPTALPDTPGPCSAHHARSPFVPVRSGYPAGPACAPCRREGPPPPAPPPSGCDPRQLYGDPGPSRENVAPKHFLYVLCWQKHVRGEREPPAPEWPARSSPPGPHGATCGGGPAAAAPASQQRRSPPARRDPDGARGSPRTVPWGAALSWEREIG